VTPMLGRKSSTALLLTSSSRAKSLMRTFSKFLVSRFSLIPLSSRTASAARDLLFNDSLIHWLNDSLFFLFRALFARLRRFRAAVDFRGFVL
jgi:hypothetical protein